MTKISSSGVPVYTLDELKSISVYAIEHPASLKKNSNETGTFQCSKRVLNFTKGVYRSVLSPNVLLKDYPNHTTVVDLFEMGLALNPNVIRAQTNLRL